MKKILPILFLTAAAAAPAAAAEAAAAKWGAECGACHVAYPPQFLPAATWRRIMSGLDKHFGSDASLDAATTTQIQAYLVEHAGSRWRRDDPPSLRISETSWFRHEHNHEMDPAVFKDPRVKSAANCGACHVDAARGNFSEENVRIPVTGARRDEDDD